MAGERVKHRREKIRRRLWNHPLEAVLAVVAPLAVLTVAARLWGTWILDVAFVALAAWVTRPVYLHVRGRARLRARTAWIPNAPTAPIGWIFYMPVALVAMTVLWCRAWIDVLVLWFSTRRRNVANFEIVWGKAHRARNEPCPDFVTWPKETNEGVEFILGVPDEARYDSSWLASEEIALQDKAGAGCRNVRMARLNQGGHVICTFVYRDPLKIMRLGDPPVMSAEAVDIIKPEVVVQHVGRRGKIVEERRPIDVGMNTQGGRVVVQIYKRNILVGGLMDMGKSTWMAQLVAMVGLSTNARLWFVDCKAGIEVKPWRDTCHRVAIDATAADQLLKDLEVEMDAALAWIEYNDLGEIDASEQTPANVLVIDELAELILPGQQKRLARIMRLGRAAGISVIAATQRPHNKLIDTNVRALFHSAVAFGCKDEVESDLILGPGMAARGYNAGDLHASGEFYYVAAQSTPLRCLSYDFDRDKRRKVAARCKRTPESGREYESGQSAPDMQVHLPREGAEADRQTVPPEPPLNRPQIPAESPRLRVWETLVTAGDEGLGFNELVKASKVSRDTATKALQVWQVPDANGICWVRQIHGRYHAEATIETADLAS